MPFINIKVTREGVTSEQKARLIKGATDLLKEVLGKDPKTTFVVIDEVDTDNWGVGGEQITAIRKRQR
jgi:4-oxalocrotonate tautomerase